MFSKSDILFTLELRDGTQQGYFYIRIYASGNNTWTKITHNTWAIQI